jgi:hypothetical protein
LRIESKGASPILGYLVFYSFLLSPFERAKATSAHSVGSPTISFVSASTSASEQVPLACASFPRFRRMVNNRHFILGESPGFIRTYYLSTAQVSTAVSLRIIAFFLDIFVTPIESTMVTTAASPSVLRQRKANSNHEHIENFFNAVRYALNIVFQSL